MEDDLFQYLECEVMWTILISAVNIGSHSVSCLSLPPTQRLCLRLPSVMRLKLLAGAFLVYHALKFDDFTVVVTVFASGDFSPVLLLACRLAVHHYRDLDIVSSCSIVT